MMLCSIAEYYGMQTPAAYNSVDLNKYKERGPSFSQKSKLARFKPLVKNDLPSPVSYNPKDALTHFRATVSAFPKGRVKNFVDQQIKAKNFVPSPNSYDVDRARRFITLGARTSYR